MFFETVSCLILLSCHQAAPANNLTVKAPAPAYGSVAQPQSIVTKIPHLDPSTDNALWFDVSPRDQVIRDCVHVAFPQCGGGGN